MATLPVYILLERIKRREHNYWAESCPKREKALFYGAFGTETETK